MQRNSWSGSVMDFGVPIWWWLLWIVMLVNGLCCLGCWEQERIALLQLKASFNYPNGTSLPSWKEYFGNNETTDCCKWEGIECNTTTRRTIQLSLNDTRAWRLGGWHLNASLFLPFKELNILHLPANQLAGCVQNEGFERLSVLSNLEVLDLSYNYFNKSILSSLAGISSLKSLNLGFNRLNGSIHINELNDFISLKSLDLSVNEIESFKPIQGFESLLRLSSLEVLDLSSNYFNNNILSSLSRLSSLKSLNLGFNRIKGSINIKELNALSNLEELDISYSEIDNFVIPEGTKILTKLKVLRLNGVNPMQSTFLQSLDAFLSLKTLYLQSNNFTGMITTRELRNLSNVEGLFLDNSTLNKIFLQSIGVMTSLKVLSLSHCELNGTLPSQGWCELKNLQELDLRHNEFEGILPSCLGNMKSLRQLDLSYNQFAGNIASSPLTSLISLEYLSLSNNHFQVPVSFKSFGNHSNLKVIFIDNNKLVGGTKFQTWIPRFQLKAFSMSNCTQNEPAHPSFLYYQYDLRFVDLSHNNIGGEFSASLLENNTRLETLILRDNSFIGPLWLPSHFNPNIRVLDISDNHLQGQIPTNISSIFPDLVVLNMSTNMFEGNIPSSLGDLKNLLALDLSNNQLLGGIPEHLAMGCSELSYLKLSKNNLHGKIFPTFLNLDKLQFLYLDSNNFVGKIPDSLSTMPLLVLDISNNHLWGMLPRRMGKMSNLMEISMATNQLEGPIPIEFCKLERLLFLDLFENNLSGSVPSCFNPPYILHVHLNKNRLNGPMTRAFYNSSSLVTLNLGENNLTGSIPNWIGSLSALSILLLKANRLEGRIPIQLCHLNKISMMDLSRNNLSGTIPHCLNDMTFEANDAKSIIMDGSLHVPFEVSSLPYVEGEMSTGLGGASFYETNSLFVFPDVLQEVEFATKNRSYSYKGDILNYMSGIDLSCNQLTGEIPFEIGYLSNIHALNMSYNNLTGLIPTTFSNLRQIESLDLSYNNLNGRIPGQLTELTTLAVFSVRYNNLSGMTPDRKAQFGTFEESSYEGNPLLCGPPLHINCTKTVSPSQMPNVSDNEGEDSGLIDMGVFYVSFIVSYISVLLGIVAVLYINPYWRRVWFHLLDVCITSCYYFLMDNFPKLSNNKNM